MTRCLPGDSIICIVKEDKIVNVYDDKAYEQKKFDIISQCEEGYLIHIPYFLFIKDSFLLTEQNYKKYKADKRFIDSYVAVINDHKIYKIKSRIDGMCCSRCKEFVPMAAANDGDKFYCFLCRTYIYR